MTEELQPVANVPETPPVVEPETPPAAPTEPVVTPAPESVVETPPTPSLAELLNKADAKELRQLLRSHERVRGIVGTEIQEAAARQQQADQERRQKEADAKKREEEEKQYLDFAEGNVDYLKEHYPRLYERYEQIQLEKEQRKVDDAQKETVSHIAKAVGASFQRLPEWEALSPEFHQTLARELTGKDDREAILTFNQVTFEEVSKLRAERMFKEWVDRELGKERDVIRQEVSAELLKTSEAPDTTKPKGPPKGIDVNSMSDEEFRKFANKRGLIA